MASYQPRRKKSGLRPWTIGFAGLVASGIALAILFRHPLIETVLVSYAERQGVGPVSLEVKRVDLSALQLAALNVAQGTLTADTLEVTYSLGSLWRGEVNHITIDGLAVRGAWKAEGLSFGTLERLVAEQLTRPRSARRNTNKSIFTFSQLKVSSALIQISHPNRPITVKTDLSVERSTSALALAATSSIDGPNLEGTLSLAGEIPEGDWLDADLTGDFNLSANAFNVPGLTTPLSADAGLSLTMLGRRMTLGADRAISLTGPWPQFLAAIEGQDTPVFDLTLRHETPNAPLFELAPQDGGFQAQVGLDFEATTPIGGGDARISGQMSFDAEGHPRDVAFDRLYLVVEQADTPAGTLTGTFSADGLRGPTSELTAPVNIEGQLTDGALGDATFKTTTFRAQAAVSLDDSSLKAKVGAFSGEIVRGRYGTRLETSEPITFALAEQSRSGQTLTLARNSQSIGEIALDMAFQSAAPAIKLNPENSPLSISALIAEFGIKGSSNLSGKDLKIDLILNEAKLQTETAALSSISATITGTTTDLSGPISAVLNLSGASPGRPAARIEGIAEYDGNSISYEGLVSTYSEKELGMLALQYDLIKESGQLEAEFGPAEFGGNGITPSDLAPFRLPATPTSGQFAARLGLPLGPSLGEEPGGSIFLKDLDLEGNSYAVRSMNTAIQMTSIWPPQTAGPQNIAIGLLQAGVPLTNVQATFDVQSNQALEVDDISMTFAGGRLLGGPFSVRLDGQTTTARLTVEDVSLPILAELSTLEGLEASGQLSGTIPVRLNTSEVLIDQGTLTTQEPGFIRYRPSQAVGALGAAESGQGGMGLAMQALEDFQYDSLTVSVSGSILDELEASLAIKGRNPALYNGYPIDFNLNLSGELANVIQGSLAGYRVPEAIKRQLLAFPPDQ